MFRYIVVLFFTQAFNKFVISANYKKWFNTN